MNFSHFLLTQFNLRNFPLSSHEHQERWLTWTRNRIILFNTYCLPSILNQSEKDFLWLIYFDVDTPYEFHGFLEDLKSHDFIKVCYSRGYDDFTQNYMSEVTSMLPSGKEWVITTRLDNDDALHCEAMEMIQHHFVTRKNFLISLASGYVLDTDRNVLAHYYYPMSPFLSLIEFTGERLHGVFIHAHSEWKELKLSVFKELYLEYFRPSKRKSQFIFEKPLWIQIYHGSNVSNSFYRGFPVLHSVDLSIFGLHGSSLKLRLKMIINFFNYVIWKRYFKSLVVKILLKK